MKTFLKLWVSFHVAVYRATGGRVMGSFGPGRVLLLSTVGHRTGQVRTVPLMYFTVEGKDYVVASAGGAPEHPAWYRNLAASADVEVQRGPARQRAHAITVEGDERARAWTQITAQAPQFSGYEKKVGAGRVIPVVRLDDLGA